MAIVRRAASAGVSKLVISTLPSFFLLLILPFRLAEDTAVDERTLDGRERVVAVYRRGSVVLRHYREQTHPQKNACNVNEWLCGRLFTVSISYQTSLFATSYPLAPTAEYSDIRVS